MVSPPQQKPNGSKIADEQERVFRLKLAGLSHDRIAAELGISHGTVANRLKSAIADHVGPVAEEYADAREAELVELFARSYRIVNDPTLKPDVRLRAMARCQALNESRRRLRGADAPQSLEISLDRRADVESELIARAVETVTEGVLTALGEAVDEGFRTRLKIFAYQLAEHEMIRADGEDPGPAPDAPTPQLAITAGTPADDLGDGEGPQGRVRKSMDAADVLMRATALLEQEEDDGEDEKDDQG